MGFIIKRDGAIVIESVRYSMNIDVDCSLMSGIFKNVISLPPIPENYPIDSTCFRYVAADSAS